MRHLRSVTLLALVLAGATVTLACSSSDDGGGSGGSGGSSGAAGSGGSSGSGASSGAGGGSGGSVVSCAQLGGDCQCAGGCDLGFHSAGQADCPQPCAGCGACSMWCCVPDGADAGAD